MAGASAGNLVLWLCCVCCGSYTGHEAAARRRDTAVLVSLMTAALAGNHQDLCESPVGESH